MDDGDQVEEVMGLTQSADAVDGQEVTEDDQPHREVARHEHHERPEPSVSQRPDVKSNTL